MCCFGQAPADSYNRNVRRHFFWDAAPLGPVPAVAGAWESNPLRTLIPKDLRHCRILPILRFVSFAAVNPKIVPSA